MSGDLGDAKDARRSEYKPGEPANDVRDGLEAAKTGLLPSLGLGLRAEVLDGMFRQDVREGVVSPATSTQLALMGALVPFSCRIFFTARGGVPLFCDSM